MAAVAEAGLDQRPVTELRGVGPRIAERLERLGIRTLQDLLFHLPLRYQDRTRVLPIGGLRPGVQAVVEGEVALSEIKRGRRRTLLVRISDGTGSLTLRFFHFSARMQSDMQRGQRVRCFGEVRNGPLTLEMVHPEFKSLTGAEPLPVADHLTPIYPTTEGVHQLTLRELARQVIDLLDDDSLRDWLPDDVLQDSGLPALANSLRYVHQPPTNASVESLAAGNHPAIRRLAFEELLAHHLSLRQLRARVRADGAPVLADSGMLAQRLVDSLPFVLTDAQQRVISELRGDLATGCPMMRLVQGDVGAGKTIVAAVAALAAVEAGCQAAIMAPTELLAEQHLQSFTQWFEPLGIEVGLLTGRLKGQARTALIERLEGGDIGVIIGTHALFQQGVEFQRLALIIIDEQHRFGVHQRLALREKGTAASERPHQLIMTATPIPRTLAMTAYADLDVSVIDELPPGRTPVQTAVLPDARRADVVARVQSVCAQGQQAYWVCTLIEESEALQCEAAEQTAAALAGALVDLRVGLVHGRMKGVDKEAVMQAFKQGEYDLLVATTVIEVGVAGPNASLMIIENAERLGMAQLHQLRGRVGRGAAHSHCVLMYRGPLSENARSRLATLRETTDGFEIARRDLELRGPGEVLGTRQTGLQQLHIADLTRDQSLLPGVRAAADQLLRDFPAHVAPLVRRWLGEAQRFGDV